MTGRGKGRSRVNVMLFMLCASLAWIVFLEQNQTLRLEMDSPMAGKATSPQMKPLTPPAVFSMPPRTAYSEIVERPLFSRTRRPQAASVTAPAPDPTKPKLALIGITIIGSEQVAIFMRLDTREVLRRMVDDEIDGWRLESVEPRRASLAQGEKVEIYKLQEGVVPRDRPRKRRTTTTRPGANTKPPATRRGGANLRPSGSASRPKQTTR